MCRKKFSFFLFFKNPFRCRFIAIALYRYMYCIWMRGDCLTMKEEKRKNEYYGADGCQITIVFLRAYSYCFDYQLKCIYLHIFLVWRLYLVWWKWGYVRCLLDWLLEGLLVGFWAFLRLLNFFSVFLLYFHLLDSVTSYEDIKIKSIHLIDLIV